MPARRSPSSGATPTGSTGWRSARTARFSPQEGGRRLVQFTPDGRTVAVDALLDRQVRQQPRISWSTGKSHLFTDPTASGHSRSTVIFPFLDHCSCCGSNAMTRAWVEQAHLRYRQPARGPAVARPAKRFTSPTARRARVSGGNCAPYPIRDDGTLDHPICCNAFGSDHRGQHAASRACVSTPTATSSRSALAPQRAGPAGLRLRAERAVIESHPIPADLPNKCCFGGPALDTLTSRPAAASSIVP